MRLAAPLTLADVKSTDDAYPVHVLDGITDALVLFAAGFHGRNDCVWLARAGVRATCVDTDGKKLTEMVAIYPEDWTFITADVYRFNVGRTWDLVSVDPYTTQFQECADRIDDWCELARRTVVIGTGVGTEVDPPAGWEITDVRARSGFQGGVFWTVLEKIKENTAHEERRDLGAGTPTSPARDWSELT